MNGDPSKDYGFCTDNETNPWWIVDLEHAAEVHFLRIFNRDKTTEAVQLRASPLIVEVSNDREQWTLLFQTQQGYRFGGYGGGRPLLWSAKDRVKARFIRISIPRREFLHLAEVEIYGVAID